MAPNRKQFVATVHADHGDVDVLATEWHISENAYCKNCEWRAGGPEYLRSGVNHVAVTNHIVEFRRLATTRVQRALS